MVNAPSADVALGELEAAVPLATGPVPIDDHCTGDRWTVHDQSQLARLVAIIAMGQAAHAAHILRQLLPARPAFTTEDLRQEAKLHLTVQEEKAAPRTGYPRWQRDGFIFEAISWIAARQTCGARALLKDPHVSATSQGLDGLMLELAEDKSKVTRTTVFEDKCTDDPRKMFRDSVIRAFLDGHGNKRSAELVATASVLLRMAGIDEASAAKLSAAVLDRKQRQYRAAFALTDKQDSQEQWQGLFKGFDVLDGISAEQRIGAGFVVPGDLRPWFDALAAKSIAFLDELAVEEAA